MGDGVGVGVLIVWFEVFLVLGSFFVVPPLTLTVPPRETRRSRTRIDLLAPLFALD